MYILLFYLLFLLFLLIVIWRCDSFFYKKYEKEMNVQIIHNVIIPPISHNADNVIMNEKCLLRFEKDIGKLYVKIGEDKYEANKSIEIFKDKKIYIDEKYSRKKIKCSY